MNFNKANHRFLSHTWWNIQVRENSSSILERDKTPRSLKKQGCIPEVNLEGQGW